MNVFKNQIKYVCMIVENAVQMANWTDQQVSENLRQFQL